MTGWGQESESRSETAAHRSDNETARDIWDWHNAQPRHLTSPPGPRDRRAAPVRTLLAMTISEVEEIPRDRLRFRPA